MATFIGTANGEWIDGTVAADEIHGLEGEDTLNGRDGDDLLEGGEGSDVLDGGTGADLMRGGAGSDVYYVDDAGDQVIEDMLGEVDLVIVSVDRYVLPANVENADVWWGNGSTIIGNALNNNLMGWWSNDRLEGGAGNDYLHGASGSDVLVGGSGNDRYHLNDEDDPDVDIVIELSGGGIDTVELWWWSYHVLAANVENVEIYATDEITLIANNASNHITAGGGVHIIDGGAGNDTVSYHYTYGPVDVDLLTGVNGGEAADDQLVSVENLTGTGWDDALRGTNGANVLTGGFGSDILEGRGGNDIYYADHTDVIIEAPGGGIDEIRLPGGAFFVMPDEVERLRAGAPDGSVIAWGNSLNNDITGGPEDDTLYGGDGHDNLVGSAGDDALFGEAGHDMLSGGAGADAMAGGDGNDAYTVDHLGDAVTEAAGEGIDTVYASVPAYLLPDEVEVLHYNGNGAFTGTGNALANAIHGGSGADLLDGAGGADELRGGSGNDDLLGGDGNDLLVGSGGADVLTGGAGADIFLFSGYESGTGADADRIVDFTAGEDAIDLSGIDADLWTAGNQAFAFIADAAFSGVAGELRYAFDGADTRLQADTDGDGISDYEIVLSGPLVPLLGDFVL